MRGFCIEEIRRFLDGKELVNAVKLENPVLLRKEPEGLTERVGFIWRGH